MPTVAKNKTVFRITYNAPVVLTFTLICIVVMAIGTVTPKFVTSFFLVSPTMSIGNPLTYFRLVSHTMGHAGWDHLTGNLMFVLLLGPMLEEKYGSKRMLIMFLVTALATAAAVVFLFKVGLYGASGLVFMLIVLSSLVNFKSGEIPLTFLLIALLFFGKEIFGALQKDQISQFAHIIGGVCGSLFGFGRKLSAA
jgi:membrane associated rhomboid family serine protease